MLIKCNVMLIRVSVMLAEMLVGIYKKLWADLLPSNTATKAQKVEVNESDSLCHSPHTQSERLTYSCREGQEKREPEKQGRTTFCDYLKDFSSFNSSLICVRIAALKDI